MPLITQTEVKTRLNISVTTFDDLIDAMIEDLVEWLPNYLNNHFTNSNLSYQASTLSFATLTITDTAEQFVEEGFIDDMDIYVFGSDSNDGHYTLDTVAVGTMSTVNDHTFTIEAAADAAPIIFQVQFPKGLRSIVSNMIKYQIEQTPGQGAKSEKIGDYSVTYKDTPFAGAGVSAYPSNIIGSLTPYRKVKWR